MPVSGGRVEATGTYSVGSASDAERRCGFFMMGVDSRSECNLPPRWLRLSLRWPMPSLSLRSPATQASRTMSLSNGAKAVVTNLTMKRGTVESNQPIS
jgi:hypothetical protein